MNDQDTALLVELISSKICHDLTSPVGAIANGIEIMEEMGVDEDVTSLISFSAEQASAKLKTLRLAYGLGGADDSIKIEQIHQTFGEFIGGDNRITQDWDPNFVPNFETRRGFPKMLMNCLLLICETLPRGGTVSAKAEGEDSVLITASGENANVKDILVNTLEQKTSPIDLSPKLIHPYITGLLAKKYGYEISIEAGPNDFISLRLKQASVSS